MHTFTSSRFFALILSTFALAACTAADVEDVDVAEGELAVFGCTQPEITKEKPNARFAQVVDVRAAGHAGYDRFVIEFERGRGVPGYHVARQRGAKFFLDGSGDPLQLPGRAGIVINVQNASQFDLEQGKATFDGPYRFNPGGAKLMTEAAMTGDFEGTVSWAIGLKRAACYRVFELTNPPRLVIDVQNDGATPPDPVEPPGTAFKCGVAEIAQFSPSNTTSHAELVEVRSAGHADYDRFVMEFGGDVNVPNFSVKRQGDASFSGPETSFTLPGRAGLSVNAFSTPEGGGLDPSEHTYSGPQTITPAGGDVITKARAFADIGGFYGWGLGLKRDACFRAFKLSDPPRLVVDVKR